ncbi:MAG TPA: TauD/TfdA family dioxygenase [Xanthomonadales bacterium]|nr:TauD/TfdA family dioxygenase [Xanthomonadales bacterium]
MVIEPFKSRAAWEGRTLEQDRSWVIELTDSHRQELAEALVAFKAWAHERRLTAQWLHGNMMPPPESFPLPTLAPLLRQAQQELEEGYGLILFRGFPVDGWTPKDLHLLHAGCCSHVGTPRPQTVFGELVQDLRDIGQGVQIERRGSKHNRALSLHNDPCDVVSFLCIQPAYSGGIGQFASSVAIHNALLEAAPQHVETLYEVLYHSYQEYLFVLTGSNQEYTPRRNFYPMPVFSQAEGKFACKYSRFYIDQAQSLPGVPVLSTAQKAALDALEAELENPKWRLAISYERGDVVLVNNYICFHGRTPFEDSAENERQRRHMLRLWLAMPNSRPLAPAWLEQVFYRQVASGAIRGGVPGPEPTYS